LSASRRAHTPWLTQLALATAVVGLAWAARHGLVEPPALTARCDAAPWADGVCALRSAVVQMFIDQRIGWASVGLGVLAWRWRRVAAFGVAAAAAGLVLYAAGPASVGLLLSALAGARPARAR
jgi:hypothetical protein